MRYRLSLKGSLEGLKEWLRYSPKWTNTPKMAARGRPFRRLRDLRFLLVGPRRSTDVGYQAQTTDPV